MKTTIDTAGRLVIPKPVRDEAGLRPGVPLEVTFRDGRIEIEPAPRQVRIVERDGLCVAEPLEPSGPLREETARKTRRDLRLDRKRH